MNIRIQPHKFVPVLEDIVTAMNDYYRSSDVQTKMAYVWGLLIWAATLIVGAGWIFFNRLDIL